MEKIKLGLQISPTNSSSFQTLLIINGGDWQHSCGDMRTIIKAIGINDKPFIWVTFQGKDGYTIAVVMPFGRNDNTTAFIHVPAKAKITGRELNHFVEEVKKVICSNAANPDMTNLKALFSKEVDEKEVASPAIAGIKSKEDGPLAYRMYGMGTGYTLSELLDRLSQTYYANYRGVFFIDKSSGIEVVKGKGEDLSSKRLLSTIIINVPEEQDGFKSERHGSIELTEGALFSTTYKKKGYKDIQKKIYTAKRGDNGNVPSDLTIDDTEKLIEVQPSYITVYDRETYKPILASITIEYSGGEIRLNNGVGYIPEQAFLHGGITIRANAEGYKEDSNQISKKEDLLLQRLRFDLKPAWQHKSESYPGEIEIKKHRVKNIILLYDTQDEAIQPREIIDKIYSVWYGPTYNGTKQTNGKGYPGKIKQDPNPSNGPEKEPYKERAGLILLIIIVIFLAVLAYVIYLHPTNWGDKSMHSKGKDHDKTEQIDSEKINNLETENANLRTEIDKLKNSGASSTELEKLKEENKKLRTEIDKLKNSGASSTELEKLKEENKKLRTEIDELKNSGASSTELEKLKEENKKLRIEIDNLKKKLNSRNLKI